MRIDNLQQYVRLRRELVSEKASIESRLQQINEALGELGTEQTRSQRIQTSAGPGRRPSGGTSLRNLVIEVLSSGAKTKEEVLQAVQQRGYRFSTNNPLNSLGVILYGKNPKFDRVEGRFSVPKGVRASSGGSSGLWERSGKRQMSAAARARIAAAQKKRWAASRGGASTNGSAKTARRQMSPAARRKIAEAARKRWAAAKAAGRNAL